MCVRVCMSIAYVNTCTSVCEERAREVDCVKGSFARVLFREERERERERIVRVTLLFNRSREVKVLYIYSSSGEDGAVKCY